MVKRLTRKQFAKAQAIYNSYLTDEDSLARFYGKVFLASQADAAEDEANTKFADGLQWTPEQLKLAALNRFSRALAATSTVEEACGTAMMIIKEMLETVYPGARP